MRGGGGGGGPLEKSKHCQCTTNAETEDNKAKSTWNGEQKSNTKI